MGLLNLAKDLDYFLKTVEGCNVITLVHKKHWHMWRMDWV